MYRPPLTEPKRPYKNLADFRVQTAWTWTADYLAKNPDKYPCLSCTGRGWIYDPNDPPCPVEGNKNRDRLRCTACGTSGIGTRKACLEAYKEAIRRYNAKLADYRQHVAAKQTALAKLTKAEISALILLGLEPCEKSSRRCARSGSRSPTASP